MAPEIKKTISIEEAVRKLIIWGWIYSAGYWIDPATKVGFPMREAVDRALPDFVLEED